MIIIINSLYEGKIPYYNAEYSKQPVMYSDMNLLNDPLITVFPIKNAEKCVLIFPGGGYFARSDTSAVKVAHAFNERGYFAYIVHYRVGNMDNTQHCYHADAIFSDGARAVRYARKHAAEYGYRSDKIIACGFSAGGHLAMALSLYEHEASDEHDTDISAVPNGVVLGYPVTTLEEGTFPTVPKILCNSEPGFCQKYSGECVSSSQIPPTFIWYGEDDTGVSPDYNSLRYYTHLRQLGVTTELHTYTHTGHGVGLAAETPAESWIDSASNFILTNI